MDQLVSRSLFNPCFDHTSGRHGKLVDQERALRVCRAVGRYNESFMSSILPQNCLESLCCTIVFTPDRFVHLLVNTDAEVLFHVFAAQSAVETTLEFSCSVSLEHQ